MDQIKSIARINIRTREWTHFISIGDIH